MHEICEDNAYFTRCVKLNLHPGETLHTMHFKYGYVRDVITVLSTSNVLP